jgi:hypothetical protein
LKLGVAAVETLVDLFFAMVVGPVVVVAEAGLEDQSAAVVILLAMAALVAKTVNHLLIQ